MNFAEMLIKFRERRRLNKTDLARKIGVSLGYVQHVEAERRKPFPIDKCKEIARILSLNETETNQLLDAAIRGRAKEEVIDWIQQQETDIRSIPVISWIHANQFREMALPLDLDATEHIPIATKKENIFALKVIKDCMCNPSLKHSFCDGEIIIIDPGAHAESGDFVVVKDSKSQEATFKQLLKKGRRVILHPLNPKYPDIELDHDERYEIVGKVIGKYTKL